MGRFADLLNTNYDIRPNDKNDKSPPSIVSVVTTKTIKDPFGRFGRLVVARNADPVVEALAALEARCPAFVEPDRWQQCIEDGRAFLSQWGEQAKALGWTAEDLLRLHTPPADPHPSYNRLSRYDCTGLIWGLEGRRVVALTDRTAAIEAQTGNIITYRKEHKPAYGPLGDSLDDFIA